MGVLGFNFDLTEQLTFYGRCGMFACTCAVHLHARNVKSVLSCHLIRLMHHSYHNNRWNQLLHFFFVPLILWSVAVWGCYSGALPSGPYTPKLPFQPELHIPDFISR